jgi:hypothetical protein
MAYLNAPIILAARQQARTFDAVWDAGMPAFKDYSRPERYALLDSYPGELDGYTDAQRTYMGNMARTVGLVCTAAEVQPNQAARAEMLVSTGLAARGLAAVVRHELKSRINIMEARFAESKKGARNRAFASVIKNGPAECMADSAGYRHRPESVDDLSWWMVGDLQNTAARRIEAISDGQTTLEGAVLTVIEGIVPAQTDIERAVYTTLPIAWQP